MPAEITLPDLGLGPAETAVLSVWFAEEGEEVFAGDRLVEVLLAGATFDVAAPITGRLIEIRAYPEDELRFGQVLGLMSEAVDEGSELDSTSGTPTDDVE